MVKSGVSGVAAAQVWGVGWYGGQYSSHLRVVAAQNEAPRNRVVPGVPHVRLQYGQVTAQG